jgi:hypothetical protein
VGAQWTVWAWSILPIAAVGYWTYPWRVDSYIHVPLWATLALVMLAMQVGWWALLPVAPAIAGGAIKLTQPGADSWLHSCWHVLGGIAAALLIFLL